MGWDPPEQLAHRDPVCPWPGAPGDGPHLGQLGARCALITLSLACQPDYVTKETVSGVEQRPVPLVPGMGAASSSGRAPDF